MTNVFFARSQMAMCLAFHMVFAAPGIGMHELLRHCYTGSTVVAVVCPGTNCRRRLGHTAFSWGGAWPNIPISLLKDASMKSDQASVLAINGGSSSIKFALFEAGDLPRPPECR